MSTRSRSRIRTALTALTTALAFGAGACATQQSQFQSADNSGQGSGNSNSDNGGNNPGLSQTDDGGQSTDSHSDGSSGSHSETSGSVTTDADSSTGAIVLVLTGLALVGSTIAGVVTAMNKRDAQAYLEKHGREVRLALARGQGTFVRDVGHNLDLAETELPHLGKTLHAARGRLEPLMHDGPGFMSELARLMLADPTFGPKTRAIAHDLEARLPSAPPTL